MLRQEMELYQTYQDKIAECDHQKAQLKARACTGFLERSDIAIVMQPINHFPAHYDFIDRSKKSAEVRMSEVRDQIRSVDKIKL